MAKRKQESAKLARNPSVRIVRPAGRPFQLRYTCPVEKREVRISTGGRDEQEAIRLRKELEAKLLLGIDTKPGKLRTTGPEMEWSDFREQYRTLHLTSVRESTAADAESRLDIAERIISPKTLGDAADAATLQQLQARLLAGEQSVRKDPRSPHTVKGYMGCILGALNWAYLQNWLPTPPKLRKIKTSKQKTMKGRPITNG